MYLSYMLKIAVIDDDETEVEIWKRLQERHFSGLINVSVFQEIPAALESIKNADYDTVIVDNYIPPHKTAKYALDALKDISFVGRVIVFSNSDLKTLASLLGSNVDAELFSKEDFITIPDMIDFVNENLLPSYSQSLKA